MIYKNPKKKDNNKFHNLFVTNGVVGMITTT